MNSITMSEQLKMIRTVTCLLSVIIWGLFTFGSTGGSRRPSPLHQIPNPIPAPLVQEIQTDAFSCGFHSLSAIYKSYGLDPEKANLKQRLGTAVNAVPFVNDSKGTLQPRSFFHPESLIRVLRISMLI